MSMSLSPDPAYTTDDLTLVASLAPDDVVRADRLDVSVSWTLDGQAQADLDGVYTVPADRTAKGQVWQATAVAARGDHLGVEAVASVTIANSRPAAVISADATVPSDVDVVATATATDADDDAVTFTWAWTVDGDPSDLATDTVPAELTAKGQVWQATVIPNDGEADGEPVTASISIENVAPQVTEVALSPLDPATDATITAAVVASDVDGDAITLRYEWLVDGVVAQDSDVNTLDGALFDKRQVLSVRVTPNDGFVDGAALTSAELTVVNTAPTLTSAAIDATELFTTDSPSCTSAGWADLDGDPEDVRYAWLVNGQVVATTQTLASTEFVKGDVLACVATPWDGEVEGAPVTSDSLTVLNTAPVLATAALSTTSPAEGDTLSVVLGGASDVDGDTLSYAYSWQVNGVQVATTETLSGDSFDRGDTIVAMVTPSDGSTDGLPVTSDTATAVNTAPTMLSVAITPTGAHAADTLVAHYQGGDADGDTLSYTFAWTVNGAPVGTADTLADDLFAKHDLIGLVVTPNDGTLDGAPMAAAELEILNTAPTAPVVALSPTTPVLTSDIVCNIDVDSVDVDNDAVSYAFSWTVDGLPYTGQTDLTVFDGDTVPAAETNVGEEWVCSVVANDGEVDSAVASASVVVVDPLLADDFEDGDFAGWLKKSGNYSVDTIGADGSSRALRLDGSTSHYNGLYWSFASETPSAIRMYVRTDASDVDAAYVVFGGANIGNSSTAAFFRISQNTLKLYDGTKEYTTPYVAGTWALIEFRPNWGAQTLDWYTDGALRASGVPFRGTALTLEELHLYNFSDTTAWWDQVMVLP